jgi:acetyltransferase-like isoleucine patch superfamily enzyme
MDTKDSNQRLQLTTQAIPTTQRNVAAIIYRCSYLVQHALANLRAHWQLKRANKVGERVRLWGKAMIINHGTFTIGQRTRLIGTLTPLEFVIKPGAQLTIGERVFINYGTSIGVFESVRIGSDCNIGSYVMILDNNLHKLDPQQRLELPPSAPVVLEDNVWLGSRVIVLPGVSIGAHSVVGAGSIVTRDIPPRSVAVGVPAKIVRQL